MKLTAAKFLQIVLSIAAFIFLHDDFKLLFIFLILVMLLTITIDLLEDVLKEIKKLKQ